MEPASLEDLETRGEPQHSREGSPPLATREVPDPGPTIPKRKGQDHSRDYVKPQFIDFESPLLADLFGRLPAALDSFTALIEEQYPSPAESPEIESQRYTTEFVFQIDWKQK